VRPPVHLLNCAAPLLRAFALATLLLFASSAPSATVSASPASAVVAGSSDLTGRGSQITQKFTLTQGVAIFRARHNGQGNFMVDLLDASGRQVGLAANTIGTSTSGRAIRIPATGTYLLKVVADGAWSFKIEQPEPIEVQALPATLSGTGDDVTTFVQLPDDLVVAQSQYTGDGNFIAEMVDPTGRNVALVANEIGTSTSSTALNGGGRIVFLTVESDGPWTITLQ
jgi:hypothetical protein